MRTEHGQIESQHIESVTGNITEHDLLGRHYKRKCKYAKSKFGKK